MTKTLLLGIVVVAGMAGAAMAQDGLPPQDLPQNGGAGVRSGHITASGETVPNPGVSQGGGTTDLDRGIQRDDNKIESSICKGC